MYTQEQVDAQELRTAIGKAAWRAELGADHGMSPEEINMAFQEIKQDKMEFAVRFNRHLENLGFTIARP